MQRTKRVIVDANPEIVSSLKSVSKVDGNEGPVGSRLLLPAIGAPGIAGKELEGEIAQHEPSESQLASQNILLERINKVLKEGPCSTETELAATCLSIAEQLTGRKFRPVEEENRAGYVDGIASNVPDLGDSRIPNSEKVRLIEDLEEQLRESQKLEAIGRLAGGIAHDFNNLLTAIIGYSQLLLNRLPEGDAMRKDVDEIRNAGTRAATLINQLLVFSRKQVVQPRVLNLNVVVGGIEKMLRRLIGEDVELVASVAPGIGTVKADPGHIEQVIMNLAVNARDALREGGTITIETANVELDAEYARQHVEVEPGPYVTLSVSDNGHGMDAATMSHIFEPFFTTKEQGKGTGLGLSTVYGIVKQSSGHISVYSETGTGTTFKVYLPRVDSEPDATDADEQSSHLPCGTETVLLVEDDPLVRRFAVRVLRQLGYTVFEASDGEVALNILQKHEADKIDLMLTDIVMPRLGGKTLADRVRFSKPTFKVLFTSGYAGEAVLNNKFTEENAPFLQKPFTPSSLARKVREVLDST